MQTAFATKGTINITATFTYDRAYLNQELVALEVPEDKVINSMRNQFRTTACARDTSMHKFIMKGGSAKIIYRFNDGNPYHEFFVDSCK